LAAALKAGPVTSTFISVLQCNDDKDHWFPPPRILGSNSAAQEQEKTFFF
jgi:hypothetical protein